MDKGVARREAAVRRHLVRARCAYQVSPPCQRLAQRFKEFRLLVRGRRADAGGEHRAGDARDLQQALLFRTQALHPGVEHLTHPLRDPDRHGRDRDPELPAVRLPREEALLRQVVEHRPHEERIARRVPVDESRQALREPCAGGYGGEIRGHVGFAQRLHRQFVTQLMPQQFLRERP
jgi:hypothetical protein